MKPKKKPLNFNNMSQASKEMPANPFHVTVCATVPDDDVTPADGGVDLAAEMRLVKPAMLYADQVELCSFKAYMAAMNRAVIQGDLFPLLEAMIEKGGRTFTEPDDMEKLTRLRGALAILKRPGGSVPPDVAMFLVQATAELKEMIAAHPNMDQSRAFEEQGLRAAIDSGVVTVHMFKGRRTIHEMFADPNISDTLDFVHQYMERSRDAVVSGKTYPLFDEETGSYVERMQNHEDESFSESQLNGTKEVALGVSVMRRLPSFDNASVDQILDMRQELKRPLVKFRAAMIGFQSEIKSSVWDKDFAREADQLFRSKIEPVANDIEDQLNSNKYLKELVGTSEQPWKFIPLLPAMGTVGSLMQQMSPELTGSLALATGGTLALNAIAAYNKYKDKQEAIEGNQLYFYHGAKTRLQD